MIFVSMNLSYPKLQNYVQNHIIRRMESIRRNRSETLFAFTVVHSFPSCNTRASIYTVDKQKALASDHYWALAVSHS